MTESLKKLPDTNIILRYLLKDEIHLYEKANKLFEKVRVGEEKVIILESVLAECVYVLIKFYKIPRINVVDILKDLLHYKGIINNDREELIEALTIFSSNSSLDIVDCILCAKAKMNNMTLFTFDLDLIKVHEKR